MLWFCVSHGVGILFTDFPASVCDSFDGYLSYNLFGHFTHIGINDTELLLALHCSALFFASLE